jgi:hypothetical protein
MPAPTSLPPETQQRIVIITWPDDPDDPDRGMEPYGPFPSEAAADAWIARCQDAAALGYLPLRGACYLITQTAIPFEPGSLWELEA